MALLLCLGSNLQVAKMTSPQRREIVREGAEGAFVGSVAQVGVAAGSHAANFQEIEKKHATLHAEKLERIREWVSASDRGDAAKEKVARRALIDARNASEAVREEARSALRSADPKANVKDSDYVFITFILTQLPHGFIGLLIAVMFASALSSKAGELNALGTTSTIDLWRRFRPLAAHDEARNVRSAKWFTALWGLFAIGFALFVSFAENLIEALSYLGPEALRILLSAATTSPNPEFQRDVIHSLGNFGADGAPAIPALIAWTRHEDFWIRLWAVNALGRIAQQPAAVIPVLLSALKDSEALVRRDAAHALGRYGKAASHAVPELIRAADDADWHAQPGAIIALARIGEQPDVVLPLLVRKLHDENWILRRCAADVLGDFGGQQAFAALMDAADDGHGFVREIVFASLKKLDPAALEKSGKKFHASGLAD
jgi:hypothetical protein